MFSFYRGNGFILKLIAFLFALFYKYSRGHKNDYKYQTSYHDRMRIIYNDDGEIYLVGREIREPLNSKHGTSRGTFELLHKT